MWTPTLGRLGEKKVKMFDLFKCKEEKFWDWFVNNSEKLLRNDDQNSKIIDNLAKELKKVNQGLTFEMSVRKNDLKKEFTISADGDPNLISSVEKLYNCKPDLQDWDIKKFRQRMQGFNIEIGNVCINYDETKYWFVKDNDPEKISILLFIKDFSEDKRDEYGNAAYLFVDCILGEYDLMKYIGFIEVFGFDSEYFENAKEMSKMTADFDDWKNT